MNTLLGNRVWRWLRWVMVALLTLLPVSVLLSNFWVVSSTKDAIYTNFAALPVNRVGLVLGTSVFTAGGSENPHFTGRIAAAVELYQLGRVRHLIVSGANDAGDRYNEPRRMWQALTAAGVPDQAITMDFAGFRTLDSIARAGPVFGLRSATLITQGYHAHRALFIARHYGLHAVAYAPAGDAPGPAFRPYLRELLARWYAVVDLYALRTQPRFLGEPVLLPLDASMPPP